MKFIVSSGYLQKELSNASAVMSARPSIPILENFLLTLSKNQLVISASDLENSVKIICAVTSEDEGTVCIPSKILLDYLRNLYEQPLTFDITNHEENKEQKEISIVSDKGRYKLQGEAATTFPKEPQKDTTEAITVSAAALQEAIEQTIFAVSNDEVRPALSGILFEKQENILRLVSTDAHRLAYKNVTKKGGEKQASKVIVSKKAASSIKVFLNNANAEQIFRLSFSSNHLFVETENVQLASRLIDAQYPDYETVIPQNLPYTLRINRKDLMGAVSRLTVFSNKSNNLIIFQLENNHLKVSAQDNDFAREGVEDIKTDYSGEDIRIGFNGRFLNEILHSISEEEVIIKLSTPKKPVLIFPADDQGKAVENHLALVMPLII